MTTNVQLQDFLLINYAACIIKAKYFSSLHLRSIDLYRLGGGGEAGTGTFCFESSIILST